MTPEDRHAQWRALHEAGPIAKFLGLLFVTQRAELVRCVTRLRIDYGSHFLAVLSRLVPVFQLGAPEHHRRVRQKLRPSFSREAVARLEPPLRQHARQLIGALAAEGRCDGVEIAMLFSARAVLTWCGWPQADLRELCDLLRSTVQGGSRDSQVRAASAWVKYVDKRLLRSGCRAELVRLGHQELAGVHVLMLFAGMTTPAATLAYALLELARNPELRQLLQREPAQTPAFIEEVLRVSAPAVTLPRVTTEPTVIGGQELPVGVAVALHVGAANMEYGDHITLTDGRITRQPHWAFGAGAHRCIAAPLARLQMTVFVEEWLRQIPEFSIEPGVTPYIDAEQRALAALPLRWAVQSH
ncbi:cytochrome P450 [Mycobacterium paraffinicum]|nr:cytochrome P450 [Mycobacterium paraffinicum]MCV7309870.1 cytochrome P450 [Mycobacterium paraffinicum]